VVLAERVERALVEGDFAEARKRRRELVGKWGPAAAPSGTAFLEDPQFATWSVPDRPEEALQAWMGIERLPDLPSDRAQILRAAYLGRLLDRFPASALLEHPTGLEVDVINALVHAGRRDEGRRLMRDALLRDQLYPLTAVDDDPVADLASEGLPAPWLASLGAIRRLWDVSKPSPEPVIELVESLSAPLPDADHDRAVAFWETLGIADLGTRIPDEVRFAARKRLRQLHGDLHAAYLHNSGPYAR
jgi:hypothetical protein